LRLRSYEVLADRHRFVSDLSQQSNILELGMTCSSMTVLTESDRPDTGKIMGWLSLKLFRGVNNS
jgi:hypothetical protein